MKWIKRKLLKRALRKAWSPKVTAYTNGETWVGFDVRLIEQSTLHGIVFMLYDDNRTWWRVNDIVIDATDEITSMIGYALNDASKAYVDELCDGRDYIDTDDAITGNKLADAETRDLRNRIAEYESKYDMTLVDWFIDYILIHGKGYV